MYICNLYSVIDVPYLLIDAIVACNALRSK